VFRFSFEFELQVIFSSSSKTSINIQCICSTVLLRVLCLKWNVWNLKITASRNQANKITL